MSDSEILDWIERHGDRIFASCTRINKPEYIRIHWTDKHLDKQVTQGKDLREAVCLAMTEDT